MTYSTTNSAAALPPSVPYRQPEIDNDSVKHFADKFVTRAVENGCAPGIPALTRAITNIRRTVEWLPGDSWLRYDFAAAEAILMHRLAAEVAAVEPYALASAMVDRLAGEVSR